jgi:hypothetical protein
MLDLASLQMPYGRWWFGMSLEEWDECVHGAVAMRHGVVMNGSRERKGLIIADEFIAGMLFWVDWSMFN